jgi:hypothetical protein
MSHLILVTVARIDARDVRRDTDGTPHIASRPDHAQVHLATSDGTGGWLLETWTGELAMPSLGSASLAADTDMLADRIGAAVRAIATEEDR